MAVIAADDVDPFPVMHRRRGVLVGLVSGVDEELQFSALDLEAEAAGLHVPDGTDGGGTVFIYVHVRFQRKAVGDGGIGIVHGGENEAVASVHGGGVHADLIIVIHGGAFVCKQGFSRDGVDGLAVCIKLHGENVREGRGGCVLRGEGIG